MNLRIFSHIKPHAAFVMVCGCVILANAIPGIPASSPKGSGQMPVQVRRLETELSREKQKYQLFDIKEKDLLSRLSVLEKEVAGKRVELAAIQKEVRYSASVILSLQRQKAGFERSLRAVEGKIMERLVVLYKYARRGYMKILATASDMDQFRLRVKYLKAVMEEDRKALEALVTKKEEQEKRIAVLRSQLSLTRSTRDEEKKRLIVLKKDLEDKVILLMRTHKEKEFYQTAVKELEAGAEDLNNTLLDLGNRRGRYTGKGNASTFVKEKGRLPLPLEGRVLQGKQVLGVSAGRIRRGVYIESRSDREVRCIFPGRVAFSGRLKGYGEMVIVNHGSRFFTIFAELNKRMKKKGDRVASGDVIGLVGIRDSRGLKRVYFEIRHGAAILNTAKWLKTR